MARSKLSKYFFSHDLLLSLVGLTFFFSAGFLNQKFEKPLIQLTKQDTALNINKNILVYFNFGNKRLLTDLLWIQTLLESDLDHYAKRDLNNWLFLRFNAISLLDPKFYENYLYGGQFLDIVKDDLEGADVIYKKGLSVYPDDYRLNFNAGFLNYYETGNIEDGLKYLTKIEHHPNAPVYVSSIINKLKLALGMSLETVFELVLYNYENTKEEKLKAKLKRDLYAIRAEIDLKCLNNGKEDCRKIDFEGMPYILKNQVYYTPALILPYKINKRGKTLDPEARERVNTFK